MDLKTVQRRRTLFWEMFSVENSYVRSFFPLVTESDKSDPIQNLGLGRPPSIHLSYVDCEFPIDDEARLDDNGNILVGCMSSVDRMLASMIHPVALVHQWKYEFTKEVFAPVTELTLTAETPQYQVILELDRKVREKVLPPHLNVFMSREDEHCTPSVYMRGCLLGQFRSIGMFLLEMLNIACSLSSVQRCYTFIAAFLPRLCLTTLRTHCIVLTPPPSLLHTAALLE